LARAIYSRKEVVVVDDVLSGLDWKTQEFVWEKVFGRKGFLGSMALRLFLLLTLVSLPTLLPF
jgi:hypothetical protein